MLEKDIKVVLISVCVCVCVCEGREQCVVLGGAYGAVLTSW